MTYWKIWYKFSLRLGVANRNSCFELRNDEFVFYWVINETSKLLVWYCQRDYRSYLDVCFVYEINRKFKIILRGSRFLVTYWSCTYFIPLYWILKDYFYPVILFPCWFYFLVGTFHLLNGGIGIRHTILIRNKTNSVVVNKCDIYFYKIKYSTYR